MGLAASQARLLFITSRQNDVSAKMQRVSNDTMVLARDEDEVITKYNKMLNATTGVAKTGVNITYDGLMGYGAAENNEINFITVGAGGIDGHPEYRDRVVLNSTIANALGLTGTGAGSEFKAASGCNSASDLQARLEPALQNAALSDGVTPGSIAEGDTSTKTLWKDYVKDFIQANGEYPATKTRTSINEIVSKMGNTGTISGYDSSNGSNHNLNGVSFMQILNKQAGTDIRIADDDDRDGTPHEQAKKNIKAIATMFKDALLNALGMKPNSEVGKALQTYIDGLSANADKWNDKMDEEIVGSNGGNLKEVAWTSTFSERGRSCGDRMQMNASVLLERMLNIALSGMQDNFSGWSNVDYARTGQNDAFEYTLNSKGYTIKEYEELARKAFVNDGYSDSMSWAAALKILKQKGSVSEVETTGVDKVGKSTTGDYYTNLFNKLCSNGWYVDSDVSNLKEKIENGTYYLNGTTADNNTDLYEQVADEETRNKAEAYWNTEMKKIQRKEKILDQELTKLQTEYSSLTTDYESVKSIISQNVSRSFQYCQNG